MAAVDRTAFETELRAWFSNEICRFINSKHNGKHATKLFLSHAKQDGRTEAFDLKNYIDKLPGGDVFFDEVDLRSSEKFGAEFVERIAHATLVILLTDSWASRYWCQWEALTGKELDRPILLVDMLSDGERRHFPYLGNIPSIHCNPGTLDTAGCRRVVAAAQLETLRDLHEGMRMEAPRKAERLPKGSRHLTRAPELATIVTMLSKKEMKKLARSKEQCFVYPDPPIAEHELSLIRRFDSKLKMVTPTELLGGFKDRNQRLNGKRVAVSISDSPNLEILGFEKSHFDRLWVALSRHLLALGVGCRARLRR